MRREKLDTLGVVIADLAGFAVFQPLDSCLWLRFPD